MMVNLITVAIFNYGHDTLVGDVFSAKFHRVRWVLKDREHGFWELLADTADNNQKWIEVMIDETEMNVHQSTSLTNAAHHSPSVSHV